MSGSATKTRKKSTARKARTKWRLIGAGAVAVAVVFGLTTAGGEAPGEPAPEIALPDFEGETVRISDFEGQPLVVNYWASWCLPCLAELPGFERVYKEHISEVAFLGINLVDNPSTALAVVADTGITYPLAVDQDGSSYEAFGGFAMPTTVFIDAKGRVLEVYSGDLTAAELQERLEAHFGV